MHVGRSLTTEERPVGVRVRVRTKPWDAGQSLRPLLGPPAERGARRLVAGQRFWPQSLQRRETQPAAGRRCEGCRGRRARRECAAHLGRVGDWQ